MTLSIIPSNYSSEMEERIEDHKKVAGHLMAAAAHHLKAATHLKDGNYTESDNHSLLAQEYINLAIKTQN
jgi:hypothetical protein